MSNTDCTAEDTGLVVGFFGFLFKDFLISLHSSLESSSGVSYLAVTGAGEVLFVVVQGLGVVTIERGVKASAQG